MKSIIAATLIALCVSSVASAATKKTAEKPWAQEPTSFLGINFASNIVGDMPLCPSGNARFEQKSLCYEKPIMDNYYTIQGKPSIGLGYNYSLSAKVRDGAVEYFYLDTNSEEFVKLTQIFITRYGAPTTHSTDIVKTQSGSEFTNETLTWLGRLTTITLKKYDGDINTSSASVGNNALSAKSVEDLKKKLGSGASNL